VQVGLNVSLRVTFKLPALAQPIKHERHYPLLSESQMKYRLTPLHFLVGYYLYRAVYYFVNLDMETAGLGGFFPFALIAVSIGVFVIDGVTQALLYKHPRLLYVVEGILLIGLTYLYVKGFWLMDV
jgi:hypothetical protein